jgi:hypothetical protein
MSGIRYYMAVMVGVTPKPRPPKRFPRPGMKPEGVTRLTGKPLPLDQLRKRLGRDPK